MDRVRILSNLKFFSHPLLLLLYMYFFFGLCFVTVLKGDICIAFPVLSSSAAASA